MFTRQIKDVETMLYNVYDKDGKITRKIDKKQELSINENEWLKGVTCFVINENGEVLIEKRVNKGLTPGKLDLCSGHIDGDETQTQAMIRELGEELGISIEEAMNVIKLNKNELPFKFKSGEKTLRFLITAYCLKRKSSDVIIQKEEIDKIVWLPLEETFELIRSGRTKFPKNYDYEEIFEKVRNVYNNKETRKVER